MLPFARWIKQPRARNKSHEYITIKIIAKLPKPENIISGYRPYRGDVQPGDWLTY